MSVNYRVSSMYVAFAIFIASISAGSLAESESSKLWSEKKYAYISANKRNATGSTELDNTTGGAAGFGYFLDRWAIEAIFHSEVSDSKGSLGEDSKINGIAMHALKFPLERLPGLFGLLGFGIAEYSDYPTAQDDDDYLVTNFKLGAGYIHRIEIRDFDFGVRFDATYIYGTREERLNAQREDINSPHFYNDVVYGVGIVLPW